jgi:hypothetical protein
VKNNDLQSGFFTFFFSFPVLSSQQKKHVFLVSETRIYVKKPECPVLCTGMNGQREFGGVSPQSYKAFSGSPTGEQKKPRPVGGVLH